MVAFLRLRVEQATHSAGTLWVDGWSPASRAGWLLAARVCEAGGEATRARWLLAARVCEAGGEVLRGGRELLSPMGAGR